MPTIEDVAAVAEAAGRAGDSGSATYHHGGIMFDLRERGYCARFVRQVHEAALGLGAWNWEFSAPHARAMERKLKAHGRRVSDPRPGDIVAVNGGSNRYGHIAIYIGNGRIAENTSSNRGPGTTISKLADIRSRVTGYYRAAPVGPELRVTLDGEALDCNVSLTGGTARVDLRPVAEALGATIDTGNWPEIQLTRKDDSQ